MTSSVASTASGLAETKVDSPSEEIDYQPVLNNIRGVFNTGKTLDVKWRLGQLRAMEKMLSERCDEIMASIQADLGRPPVEGFIGDVHKTLVECRFAIKNVEKWAKPEKGATPALNKPGKTFIVRQPKGVVLIIAPWNFPFSMIFNPLVGAIAAGCCAILKPSEVSSNSAKVIQTFVEKYFDPQCFKVVLGGIPETTALLRLNFDHIFYTGNGVVGRIVMRAAAEHLTPVTLELGGKSPVIVDKDADISVTANRILHGKFFNSGQVCIAPDYVLCHKDIDQKLTEALKLRVSKMFGPDPKTSKSYGRIINKRHWKRVTSLISGADGEIIVGGNDGAIEEEKYIPPTIIKGVSQSNRIMKEEIFGPVLPLLTVENTQEALKIVNQREKPLALYVFSSNWKNAEKLISSTSAGGSCVNDTVVHVSPTSVPFGGVGSSGMGKYHGKFGFDEFSHHRTVMYRSTWFDVQERYPPYKEGSVAILKKILIGPLLPKNVKLGLQAAVFTLLAIIIYLVIARFM